MKTIKEQNKIVIEIKKSKFIAIITPTNTVEQFKENLEEIKKEYKNANHYCYAYIIENNEKASDDKEPSGTAGMPILNILKKTDLKNISCVVIRYFGGIKLGAGGLIRAYMESTKTVIQPENIIEKEEYTTIKITFNYQNQTIINTILKNFEIDNKTFDNTITYYVKIPKHKLNETREKLSPYLLTNND